MGGVSKKIVKGERVSRERSVAESFSGGRWLVRLE